LGVYWKQGGRGMTWQAIGDWVVIEKTISSGMGKIVQISDNQGEVVSCEYNPDIIGKTVMYDKFSRVKYQDVMAVME
jgi:hypothetical protein